jgi:hypothetical protein
MAALDAIYEKICHRLKLTFARNRPVTKAGFSAVIEDGENRSGANGIRTHDLLHAMQALSQLSYGPKIEQY